MAVAANERAEWLESDGLGGFASGTVSGVRTRRYHALLLAATTPPTGRVVLVNGFDAHLRTAHGRYALSSQRYAPDVVWPDGRRRLSGFGLDPWPAWSFQIEDGPRVVQELFVPQGVPAVALAWRLEGEAIAARLEVRLFLSGRDYHALHCENAVADLRGVVTGARVRFHPYASQPAVVAVSNARFTEEPFWYRKFLYEEERTRGLDHVEDLAAPGVLQFDLAQGEACLVLYADLPQAAALAPEDDAVALVERLRSGERARRALLGARLERAADHYLVTRGRGRTVVAGYPWFTDWGRDTFIALRGLCLATGRLDEARAILLAWAGAVSRGMLPNRFPDAGDEPEFNSVDAALWFVIAVHDYLQARGVAEGERERLRAAVLAILDGYAGGTRHGIRPDADGLLAAGEPGVQLTWMDARVGDHVVTPRVGKPVEVQALWLNALKIGAAFDARFSPPFARGLATFRARFWNAERGCLYDVIDADHVPGRLDSTLRPNQILALGGLPLALLEGERARRVVDAVEAHLLTPMGLRSLAPGEPGYAPRYAGGARERDLAYHQGTVWPWLLGPFVEAWVRVRGGGELVRADARARFLEPLLRHLDEAGLGHISEVADADAPHAPGGCPFQAWSVGEALRLDRVVLAPGA